MIIKWRNISRNRSTFSCSVCFSHAPLLREYEKQWRDHLLSSFLRQVLWQIWGLLSSVGGYGEKDVLWVHRRCSHAGIFMDLVFLWLPDESGEAVPVLEQGPEKWVFQMNMERGGGCRELTVFTISHLWIPHLLLLEWNVMAHLFLSLLWAAVNTLKLNYTLLKHHQYGHKKKNIHGFVLLLKEFSSYLWNQHRGFSCNFSSSLGRTKPLPWPFQWTFCLETPKLWLYVEPEGASSGLCQAGCPGTWDLEKKRWIGQKKNKTWKPKKEIKCHFYFLSQRSP